MSAVPQLLHLADRVGAAVKLTPEAMARAIQAALRDVTTEANWLPAERRRASHEHYARHMLYGDPDGRFAILSIIWDHGQMSPIHGHFCWCAVGVYQGELTESHYHEGVAGALPTLIGKTRRGAGTLSFEPAASGIHRIANDSGATAISLHIYGVGKDGIATGVNRIYA